MKLTPAQHPVQLPWQNGMPASALLTIAEPLAVAA